MTERLRIALQKSGRLYEQSLSLLERSGLHISKSRNRLYWRVENLPIDILLVRDDDIPHFVSEGICDIGIVGENVFLEASYSGLKGADLTTTLPLGFSHCKLQIAVPKNIAYEGPQSLAGMRIATSYPRLLEVFLEEVGVDAQAFEMDGSVEVAPRLKIAEAICDIVATGATLEANGLVPVDTVLTSQAVLIRAQADAGADKEAIITRLVKRFRGVIASEDNKYIMMNAPATAVDQIAALLPGAGAPTVIPLFGQEGMVAIHAVCHESVFWETLEALQEVGAGAILVLPIEKMML